MTPRQRVLTTVNHQVPDRVPIDLGGMQSLGNRRHRLRQGEAGVWASPRRTKVVGPALHDRRGRGRSAPAAARRRGAAWTFPCVLSLVAPDREWIAAAALRRHRGAVPAGHADRRRRRRQLDRCWTPTARPRPSACPRGATTSTTRRSTAATGSIRGSSGPIVRHPRRAPDDPRRLRPVALPEHRLRHPRLGIRRLLPRPEPDHRPRKQRHPRAGRTSG